MHLWLLFLRFLSDSALCIYSASDITFALRTNSDFWFKLACWKSSLLIRVYICNQTAAFSGHVKVMHCIRNQIKRRQSYSHWKRYVQMNRINYLRCKVGILFVFKGSLWFSFYFLFHWFAHWFRVRLPDFYCNPFGERFSAEKKLSCHCTTIHKTLKKHEYFWPH